VAEKESQAAASWAQETSRRQISGREFGQHGLRNYGVTCSGTNLANMRAGIRGGKIAAKVQLRAQ